jgi:hypothetical protein
MNDRKMAFGIINAMLTVQQRAHPRRSAVRNHEKKLLPYGSKNHVELCQFIRVVF